MDVGPNGRDVGRTSCASFNVEETCVAGSPSRFFPLHLVDRCPSIVQAFVPSYFAKIHDLTHVILVASFFSSLILALHVLSKLLSLRTFLTDWLYWGRLLFDLVFLLPITNYTMHVISQYDGTLVSKERDAQLKKETLSKTYTTFLSDMEALMCKSAESHAGLTEQTFESKSKSFQRFLEITKSRYGSGFKSTKADADSLLKQFRRFVLNWLAVFRECSIDPGENPNEIVSTEELNLCRSIVEVCDLCLERLRVTEVRLITAQRDQDQLFLRDTRKAFRRLSASVEPDAVHRLRNKIMVQHNRCFPKVSWFSIGRGNGCACITGEKGYPVELRFVIGRFVVLSREHVTLMVCFLMGAVVVIVNSYSFRSSLVKKTMPGLPFVLMLEGSLLFMLIHFENLDVMQKLEQEVRQLEQETTEVEQKRGKMRKFWSSTRQLTDLWLYRTAARLELYKVLQTHFEDSPTDLFLPRITRSNNALEDFEGMLGTLQDWRGNGKLPEAAKKHFAKEIANMCELEGFDEIVVKIEEFYKVGIEGLENVPMALSNASSWQTNTSFCY